MLDKSWQTSSRFEGAEGGDFRYTKDYGLKSKWSS